MKPFERVMALLAEWKFKRTAKKAIREELERREAGANEILDALGFERGKHIVEAPRGPYRGKELRIVDAASKRPLGFFTTKQIAEALTISQGE